MDILLINPPQPKPDFNLLKHTPSSPPMGLAYLATILKQNNFTLQALDFDLNNVNIDLLMTIIKEDPPKIVGITALTNTIFTAVAIAKIIKSVNPDIKIVMGGHHATNCFAECFSYRCIDFIILGEGEYSFNSLCEAIINNAVYKTISGLAYPDNNNVYFNQPEEIINLDDVGFPDRTIFDLTQYYDPINIITTRGCSYNCIFCSAGAYRKNHVLYRSAQNVLKEIEHVYKQGYYVVNFVDDNFLIKRDRVIEICSSIKKHFPKLFWTCSARVELLNEDIIKLMASSGCKGMHFGVESCFELSQKTIGKYLSLEKLENVLKLTKKYGINSYGSFILGLPDEDIHQVRANIQYAISLHKKYTMYIVFGILTPFPGTELFNNPDKYGIKILSKNYSNFDIYTPVIETKYLSVNELQSLLFDANKMYMENLTDEAKSQMSKLYQMIDKRSNKE